MLEDALRSNFAIHFADNATKMAACDYEPRICAIEVEYELWKASRLANLYKASVMKKCFEIKKYTAKKDLHPGLIPKGPNAISSSDETEPSSSVIDDPFAKMSAMLGLSKPLVSSSASEDENKDCFANYMPRETAVKKAERAEAAAQPKPVPKITYFFESNGTEKGEDSNDSHISINNSDRSPPTEPVILSEDSQNANSMPVSPIGLDTPVIDQDDSSSPPPPPPPPPGSSAAVSKITYFFENNK